MIALCDIANIVSSMHSKGIRIWSERGELHYRAPSGALSPDEIESLRARKSELIEFLDRSTPAATREPPLQPRSPSDHVPLTVQQQWLWDNIQRDRVWHFSIGNAVRISGPLDVEILKRSLEEIVRRHESLRTRIVLLDGTPKQQIDTTCCCHLEVCPLTGNSNIESEAKSLVEALIFEPCDLAKGPLFRARVLVLDDRDHILVLALDHLIADGFSLAILLRDLWSVYIQFVRGLPISLPKMDVQYADYAVWQRDTQSYWAEKHGTYWASRLATTTRVRLPADEQISHVAPFTPAGMQIALGKNLSADLHALAAREHITVTLCLLAAYAIVLSRWCGTQDMVIPFNAVGRHRSDLANTIGYFAHVLHLRIVLLEGDTFRDVLKRVVKEYGNACEHHDFGRIVAHKPQYVEGTWFQWNPRPPAANVKSTAPASVNQPGLRIKSFPFKRTINPEDRMRMDLVLAFSETAEGIVGEGGYRADLFKESTMARLVTELQALLRQCVEDPGVTIVARQDRSPIP